MFPGGAFGFGARPWVTADTGFFVLTSDFEGELYYAGRDGMVSHQVGRKGEAPGEYRFPWDIIESGQHYGVIDNRLGRVTFLHKRDLSLAGTVQIPFLVGQRAFGGHAITFSDGTIVLAADLKRSHGIDDPLHVLASDGHLLRSFGADIISGHLAPGLAISGDTAVWIPELDRYRVTRWDRDGSLLGTIERDVPWFPWPPAERAAGATYAQIHGVNEDGAGRLWVYIGLRKLVSWEGTAQQGGELRQVARPRVSSDPRDFVSVVEVLDARTGDLIASTRTTGVKAYHVPTGMFESVRAESESGQPLIEIWAYRLRS
jgi:hypothetical protein